MTVIDISFCPFGYDLYPKGIKTQRFKRVFHIGLETCQASGGALKTIVCIEDPVVSRRSSR